VLYFASSATQKDLEKRRLLHVRGDTWKAFLHVRFAKMEKKGVTNMRIGSSISQSQKLKLHQQVSYPFKKAAKLLDLNWEPESVAFYLMQDFRIDKDRATRIVSRVRFHIV
jgi:hypothetical protein